MHVDEPTIAAPAALAVISAALHPQTTKGSLAASVVAPGVALWCDKAQGRPFSVVFNGP
jgi:hypothetical protein